MYTMQLKNVWDLEIAKTILSELGLDRPADDFIYRPASLSEVDGEKLERAVRGVHAFCGAEAAQTYYEVLSSLPKFGTSRFIGVTKCLANEGWRQSNSVSFAMYAADDEAFTERRVDGTTLAFLKMGAALGGGPGSVPRDESEQIHSEFEAVHALSSCLPAPTRRNWNRLDFSAGPVDKKLKFTARGNPRIVVADQIHPTLLPRLLGRIYDEEGREARIIFKAGPAEISLATKKHSESLNGILVFVPSSRKGVYSTIATAWMRGLAVERLEPEGRY